jgi:hypothetical protein
LFVKTAGLAAAPLEVNGENGREKWEVQLILTQAEILGICDGHSSTEARLQRLRSWLNFHHNNRKT